MADKPLFKIVVGRGATIYHARDSLQLDVDQLVTEGYIPDGPITIQIGTEPQEQEHGVPNSILFRLPDLKVVHLALTMVLKVPGPRQWRKSWLDTSV